MKIKEYLKNNRIITDGAMGTYYALKYDDHQGLAELVNLTAPEKILKIHQEYAQAGANLLRTNTFAANTMFLTDMDEVKACIRAGYEIAEQAAARVRAGEMKQTHGGAGENGQAAGAGREVYVACDIGPLYEIDGEENEELLAEYKQICDTFLELGGDIFLFETFSDFQFVESVSRYIKEKNPEAFVIAQFSFDKSGYTKSGISVKRMIKTAAEMDSLDAYGMNCGVEALHLYQLLKDAVFPNGKYLTALPNAGYPMELRGRTVYANNAEYFVEMSERIAELGIDIQGGCCGTTPAYIKKLAETLKDRPRGKKHIGQLKGPDRQRGQSGFCRKLEEDKKVFIVELDPPFNADTGKVMENARLLQQAGVDLITLSDSPMARARMDAGALAAKIQYDTGVPVMPHVCCRDKNLLALRGAMLGSYMNGIRQCLVITGDPVSRDSESRIKPVYNVNSIRFMEYLKEMNQDVFEGENVIYGGALNYHGVNVEAIIERMHKKEAAGCSFFLTQPVYSDEDIERLHYIRQHISGKLMCGIMPLVSYKNALFVKNEMPGIYVPEEVIERYSPEMTRKEAEQTAVEISIETAKKMTQFADGFYLMTPFNRGKLIVSIISAIKKQIREGTKQ